MTGLAFGGGWNYRVVKRDFDDEMTYAIHEVYYDDAGGISAWSANAIAPQGSDFLSDLAVDLDLMREALNKPVLDHADLPGATGSASTSKP